MLKRKDFCDLSRRQKRRIILKQTDSFNNSVTEYNLETTRITNIFQNSQTLPSNLEHSRSDDKTLSNFEQTINMPVVVNHNDNINSSGLSNDSSFNSSHKDSFNFITLEECLINWVHKNTSKPYAVVLFSDENNMTSEIPTSWLCDANSKCRWPPNCKNPTLLMKKGIKPDKSWGTFKVRVESYCSTLQKARMRAENINYETTEDEDLGRGVCSNLTESSLSGDWVFPIENTNIAFDVQSMASPLAKPDDIINLDTVSVLEIGKQIDFKKLIEISNEILLYVRSIDDRLRKIEKNPVIVPNKEKDLVIKSFLPITSIVEMKNFEQLIEDKINLQHFHQYVSRIGGRNGKETLQRICKTVFSNKFAVLCSWLGHRGNFAIKNLQTTIVIKDIILGEYADFKEKDIESTVSEWFRLAKLRLKRENEK
ncbi:hypothetical protein RN001_008336 [Aquatica leii]|uniref:DUF4806 domain-containing protein n=1 Tax=Aquatica leii TaxID=1421715 RepID=A0AAN7Q533_9COLE|nr:hypothetical protein RN001_008336 [Aquatica leii]